MLVKSSRIDSDLEGFSSKFQLFTSLVSLLEVGSDFLLLFALFAFPFSDEAFLPFSSQLNS